MSSLTRVRLLVAGDTSNRSVILCLDRMGLNVLEASDFEQARLICQARQVDACVVLLPYPQLDQVIRFDVESGAPGRGARVPSLLIAPAITPYLLKAARRGGYFAAIPAGVGPRPLYRSIKALLQQSRRWAQAPASDARPEERDPSRSAVPRTRAYVFPDMGKMKLQ